LEHFSPNSFEIDLKQIH